MSKFDLREAASKKTLIAAHRGVAGGNITCNTIEAYEVALQQKADIVELDVIKSTDDVLFAFHSGKEKAFLNVTDDIQTYTSSQIKNVKCVNQDLVESEYCVPMLDDVLETLKGRCFINLDRSWNIFKEVVECVRRHDMSDQIILKSAPEMKYFNVIEEVAPDIVYMPIAKKVTDELLALEKMNINYAGAEVLFFNDDDYFASEKYISEMHAKNKLVWVNSIVYNCKSQIAAGHNDDISVTGNPNKGWGWLVDRKFDIIQTDWPLMLSLYLEHRK